jgi:hypothetical protein
VWLWQVIGSADNRQWIYQLITGSEWDQLITGSECDRLITGSEWDQLITGREWDQLKTGSEWDQLITGSECDRLITGSEWDQLITAVSPQTYVCTTSIRRLHGLAYRVQCYSQWYNSNYSYFLYLTTAVHTAGDTEDLRNLRYNT